LVVDIDTEKSEGARFLKEACGGLITLAILGVFLKTKYNINVLNYITENKTLKQILPALGILLVALVLGKISKHRSFTHSLLGIVAYTIPVYMLVGDLYKWFLIGYIAHILTDILNKKGVRLLYPLKNGVCLNICSADGIVDKTLFIGFMAIIGLTYMADLNIF
jgi:inner membrane protein